MFQGYGYSTRICIWGVCVCVCASEPPHTSSTHEQEDQQMSSPIHTF